MASGSRTVRILGGVGLAGALVLFQQGADVRGQQAPMKARVRLVRPPVAGPVSGPAKEGEFTDALSLPTDRKATKALEAAQDFMRDELWGEAVHVLQGLLNSKQDLFVDVKRKGADGKESSNKTSIRLEANRLLGTLPPAGREVYELQYGAKARDLVSEARKPPEQRGSDELRKMSTAEILALVSQRYLHTKAGAVASDLLGTYLLDRGQPVMAALCFERLLSRQGPDAKLAPTTLLKATLAFRRVGDKVAAAQAWTRLAKLTPAGVPLGGRTVPLDELHQELDRVPFQQLAVSADEWPMLFGGPNRSALAKGGTPFLDEDINKWVQPTVNNADVKDWVQRAADQETALQNPVVPGFFPVAAGGKLVFRSYAGVHAVDLRTGKLVWEQPSNGSIEKLMEENRGKSMNVRTWVTQFYMPGRTLRILYENSTLGALSTDGSLVFAVDDLSLPPHPQFLQQFQWGNQPNFGELSDAVNHSELIAIELDTGKLKWQAGGIGDKGPLDGCFFLGPPLPLGGKLYVMVEKNAELTLACLTAATGELEWTQKLAAVRDRLTQDVGRRIQGVHLAYGEGILVCPTNAGAILGVDLLTRSLVWAKPYREATPLPEPQAPQNFAFRRGGVMFIQQQQQFVQHLNSDWKCSAPVVQDGKVVFTAPDGASIYCLNLRDGGTVWKEPRKDDVYLAGVYHGKVLLVGKQHCRALNLADAKQVWSRQTGLPSGHGVASDRVYYLPLKAGAEGKEPEVCALDIMTGDVIAHSKSRKKPGEVPGNLIFYEGKVISQTVSQVAAYPQLDVKLAEMSARIAKNPRDPQGLVERAELRRHRGKVGEAVEDLRLALANKPDETLLPKARQLLFESLTELFQRDFDASEKYLTEYAAMCEVRIPDEAKSEERDKLLKEAQKRKADFLCLVAKGKEKQSKLGEAFRYYKEFASLGDKTGLQTVIDEPYVKASPQVWAQGRIAAMIAKATPAQRQPLEAEIARLWQEVRSANDLNRLRDFVATFGSLLAAGTEARLQLAERLVEEGGFAEAELQLLQVRRQRDNPQLAGRAVELLARLCARHGLMEDAAHWYNVLGRDFGPVVIRDGKTGADFLNELATDKRFLPYLDDLRPAWDKGTIKTKESYENHPVQNQVFSFDPEGEALPFYRKHRLAFSPNLFQLKLIDRDTNEERWTQTLTRQEPGNILYLNWNQRDPNHPIHLTYLVQGHVAVFHIGTKIYGLDLVDPKGKVLWEKELVGSNGLRPQQILLNPQGGVNAAYADGRQERLGQAGPFEPGYVCLMTRAGLQALDPFTGDLLWSKSDLPAATQVFGDGAHLFLAEIQSNGAASAGRAVRGRDGVTVSVPDFAEQYQRRVAVRGRHLLVSDREPNVTLKLYDVLTGREVWKQIFSPGAIVLHSEDPDLAAVAEPNRKGQLTVIDLRTRKEILRATLNAAELPKAQGVTLLRDKDWIYVAVNGPANPQVNAFARPMGNFPSSLRGLPVNGTFYAFNPTTGQYWRDQVDNQSLVLDQFQELPIVIFTARSQPIMNGLAQPDAVKTLAKRTGKLVFRSRFTNNGAQFHTLTVDARARTIDLIGHNLKITHYLEPASERVMK